MSNNGDEKQVIDCPHCKQRFGIKLPALDQPINMLKFSAVVATHEKPIRCQNAKCAKYFVQVVTLAQFQWSIAPITDEQAASLVESPIIVPDRFRIIQ
jgi:hypothetical protein